MNFRPALLMGAFLLAGCGILDPESDGAALDLAQARSLWASAGIEDYDLLMERVCFCVYVGPARVEVRDGVQVATILETDLSLDPSAVGEYPTVEELFELVADAVAREADELRVTYHPVLGYPVDLWVDLRRDIADEEFGYRVDLVAPSSGT